MTGMDSETSIHEGACLCRQALPFCGFSLREQAGKGWVRSSLESADGVASSLKL